VPSDDQLYLQKCIEEAQNAYGHVSPNPYVGCVIVHRETTIIAKGHHLASGQPHAEVEAIKNLSAYCEKNSLNIHEIASESTLYCNLEPCCHLNKKTPPCTELLLQYPFKRIVIGQLDPNVDVSGKGVKKLRDSGINVTVLNDNLALKLNNLFNYSINSTLPYISLKWGQSLDGYLAPDDKNSRWITCAKSRNLGKFLRYGHDAILVGSSTFREDRPELNPYFKHNELEGILNEPFLSMDMSYQLKKGTWKKCILGTLTDLDIELLSKRTDLSDIIWLHTETEDEFTERLEQLSESSKTIWKDKILSSMNSVFSLNKNKKKYPVSFETLTSLLEQLKRRFHLSGLMVEGGAVTLSRFIELGLFQQVFCFIAPIILGNGTHFKMPWTSLRESILMQHESTLVVDQSDIFYHLYRDDRYLEKA